MKSNDLEYAKIRDGGDRFRQILDLVKYAIGCVTFAVALWLIFEGLTKIIAKQDPDGINALAKLIGALNIGSILGYIFGAGTLVAWKRERSGKKRAIREKNRYQKMVEKDDINRTSSGLNDIGETPEDNDE